MPGAPITLIDSRNDCSAALTSSGEARRVTYGSRRAAVSLCGLKQAERVRYFSGAGFAGFTLTA